MNIGKPSVTTHPLFNIKELQWEKRYECISFGKSCTDISSLTQHQRIHMGVKPVSVVIVGRHSDEVHTLPNTREFILGKAL